MNLQFYFYDKKRSSRGLIFLASNFSDKLTRNFSTGWSKYFLCIGFICLLPFCLKAQECGSEGFELLIETSLGTGQVCENSTADVSVDVTPESFYPLDEIDSIQWIWYVDLPGQSISFEDIIGEDDLQETTFSPFTSTAQNSHVYDELTNLGCGVLEQLVTISPNTIEMSIGTFGFVTCDDGNVERHFNTVGFDLLLEPRASLDISPSTICLNQTAEFINIGCFGDTNLSFWTLDGTVIQSNGNDVIPFIPTEAGTFEVCLNLVNSCGTDVACKNITVVPEPDALFSIPPELQDGEGCAGTYEFCNISDTVNFYNQEYYWGVYFQGSLQGQLDTTDYKTCYDETFSTPGIYEVVLTATNFACDTVQHSFSFTIVESPTVELADPDPFCISTFTGYTPNVTYTGNIIDYSWTFDNGTPDSSTDPMPTGIMFPVGTHEVNLAINSICGVQNYQTTVTIDTFEVISFSTIDDTYCIGQNDTLKITADPPNGTWSPNIFLNDSCLVIDDLLVGATTATYSIGSGACLSSESITINVIDTTVITFAVPIETFCENDGIISLQGFTPAGGTWSGTGVIDAVNGLIDVGIIGAGNAALISYSFTNSNECESIANKTIIVEGLPEATLSQDSLLLCDVPGNVDLNVELALQVLPDYTDEWIGDCVTAAGILDPVCLGIGSHILEYVIFTPNNCTDTTEITIVVEPFQAANAGEDFSECVSEGATITLIGMPEGGTWTGFNIAADGVITIDGTMEGDYDYTYTFGGANCENQDVVTVNIINLNDLSASLPDFCETETIVTLPDGMPAGGTWLYNGNALANNEINISSIGPGNFVLAYEVEAATSGNDTCTNSIAVNLFIDALPNPIIEIPADLCINVPYTITNNTTEVYTSWNWDFGNGFTATGLTPTFEYSATGDYVITLNIQDTVCQETFTWNVSVSAPPPPLDFALTPLSADSCELLEVSFTNQSQVDLNVTDVIYIWDFGNGMLDTTYSVSESPANVFYEAYDKDTIYTITLSALNNCGDVIPATASVYVKPKPISQFSADFESYCSGATVNFINSSVGNPENTIIDLGDGSPLIFDYPFDTLSYQYFVGEVAEIFTVLFISINPCGRDTVINTVEVFPVDVVAAFTVEDNGVFCQNTDFCLANAATPGATVWYDMGDGNTLFAADTCYAYALDGAYTITQFALDNCGGLDTLQIPVSIVPAPVIAIADVNPPCLGDTVALSLSTLSNDVVNVVWDFGDGSTASEQNLFHFFETSGSYTITATATTNESCSTTATTILQIEALIDVSFLMEDSICVSEPIALENTSNGSGYACSWSIDEAALVPGCNIVTTFESMGIHNITLTLTDNNTGCESKKDSVIFVRPTPSAAFEIDLLDSCNQNRIRVINFSTDANTALWSFGDDTSSSLLDSIEHIYAPDDEYELTLMASYDGICFDTLSQPVVVPVSLSSIIGLTNTNGCDPFIPNIQNQSTGNNLIYNWSTSNGLNFFEEQIAPSFITNLPSEDVIIQLIVIDEMTSCADTSDLTITVFDTPSVSLLADNVSCHGGSDGAVTSSITGGSPAYQYDWSVLGNANTITELSVGTYTLTVTDSNSCTAMDLVEITQPTPIVIAIDHLQNATCAGKEDGAISVIASGGTTNTGNEFLYDWNIDLPLSQDTLSSISELGAGFYTVIVTDELGCTATENFTIEDGYALAVIDTALGISCEGMVDGQIQIAAIENGFPNFLALLEGTQSDTINSDAGIFNFRNLPEGDYRLTIIDQKGCTYEETYLVPAWQDPTVSIYVDKPDLYRCDSAFVIANGIGSDLSYQWFPAVNFSCLNETCDSMKVSPENDITYELKVTDERGCTVTDEVTFTVDEDRTLFVPTAFTPNGDGNNDIFRIRAGEHQAFLLSEITSFNILDRWGNVLFVAEQFHPFENSAIGWDGNIEGVKAPNDMYVYWAELQFCDGDSEIIKGYIQLIR